MSNKSRLESKFLGACLVARLTDSESKELLRNIKEAVKNYEKDGSASRFVNVVQTLITNTGVSFHVVVGLVKLGMALNPKMINDLAKLGEEGMATETEVKEITLKKARKLLKELHEDTKRPFFGVSFVKRTPPYETREMPRAQFGVKKHLKGGERAYDPEEHDLLTVFDHDKKDYRSINMTQIVSLKISGVEYKVTR